MGSKPIGISGSRAAAILGVSKYTTQVGVWQELCESRRTGFNAERGYILEPFEGNAATRFGHAFETPIIELTEQATGKKITDQEGAYSVDCETPITCHIDGRFSPSHIFEGKTVYYRGFDKTWGDPGTDRIPVEYQCQVQSNMMVTKSEQCTLSALVFPRSPEEWEEEGWEISKYGNDYRIRKHGEYEGGMACLDQTTPDQWARALAQMGFFHQYNLTAKPDTQQMIMEMYEDFWGRYVIPEKEPLCTDYDDIKRLFTAPKGELILPDHMIENCREYKNITSEIGDSGDLSKRKEQIKIDVLKYLRKETTVESDDAQEKIVLLDQEGNNIGSYNGKVFRVSKKA